MCLLPKRQSHTPYLWLALFTTLLLVAFFFVETEAVQPLAEAGAAPVPQFSAPGGYYEQDVELQISLPAADLGHAIVFTRDGSLPTDAASEGNGTIYTRPIHLEAAEPAVTVIRARALLPNGALGPVASASYFMGVPATIPMISLIVDPDDLWHQQRGIYANPEQRGRQWERPVHITYVDTDRRSGFHVEAGLRIHGQFSRAYAKKSFRFYFRQEYGPSRLDYPVFPDSQVQSFKRLVLHASGQDTSQIPTNWTMMRNQIVAGLAMQTNAYATHSRSVIVFINGEPWGLYYLRERIDRFFLADEVGAEAINIVDTPARRIENPEEIGPGFVYWDHLTAFVDGHDLADPVNYAYVQSQVDLANFIDYSILQIYSANFDWPFSNMKQFRSRTLGGRWHWVVWDNDLSLGLNPWSDVSMNTIEQALDRGYTAGTSLETDGRDTILLRGLLQNPTFRARFLNRTADLLNTILAPDAVVARIDSLAAVLEPNIAFESRRWQGKNAVEEWRHNVEQLRDFARRRPEVVWQQMVDSLGLPGTARLTLTAPGTGQGKVAIDGRILPALPWQGTYFVGGQIQVTAVPEPGYRFAGWEADAGSSDNPITVTIAGEQTLTPRFVAVSEDTPQPGDVVFDDLQTGEDGRLQLRVVRPDGVDLRGWRLTDNDSKTSTDEGSLIFAHHPAFARVPSGTTISIVLAGITNPGTRLPADDLDASDRQMRLYPGNGHLDSGTDSWFRLGANDNAALLAPGATADFGDDRGIAFTAWGESAVTPATFGILGDGVTPSSTP